MVTVNNVILPEMADIVRRLGKIDWLTWKPSNTNPAGTQVELNIDATSLLSFQEKNALKAMANDHADLFVLYLQSRWLANGPKLLRPSFDYCNALRHVDVTVSFGEYQQPFTNFVVELPERFRRKLASELQVSCPRFVMLHHDTRQRYIFVAELSNANENECFALLRPQPHWTNLQLAINDLTSKPGSDRKRLKILTTIGINFGLLLSQFGVKNCGPVDQKAYQKQPHNAERKKGRNAERAKRFLANTVERIDFSQEVVLHRNACYSYNRNANGSEKKPHWRRGHYRRQLIGTGRSGSKLVFIKPMLIRADAFHGDLADTSYSIEAR